MSYQDEIRKAEEFAADAINDALGQADAGSMELIQARVGEALVFQLKALRIAITEAFAPHVQVTERASSQQIVDDLRADDRHSSRRDCEREHCGHTESLHVRGEGECHATVWDGASLVSCRCPGFLPEPPDLTR